MITDNISKDLQLPVDKARTDVDEVRYNFVIQDTAMHNYILGHTVNASAVGGGGW